MRLSTKARYGTRLLVDLASQQEHSSVMLKDIARRQNISVNYLKHLIAPLIAAGIIRTERGNKGGVWLAKPPCDIKVSEIVSIMEGSTAPVACIDNPDVCKRHAACATRLFWQELKQNIDSFLDSTTIHDLAERQRMQEKSYPLMRPV